MQVETQNSVESQQEQEKRVTADKQKQHTGDEEIQEIPCEGSETAKSSEGKTQVSLQEDTVDKGSKEEAQNYPERAQGLQNCGENKESTNHY